MRALCVQRVWLVRRLRSERSVARVERGEGGFHLVPRRQGRRGCRKSGPETRGLPRVTSGPSGRVGARALSLNAASGARAGGCHRCSRRAAPPPARPGDSAAATHRARDTVMHRGRLECDWGAPPEARPSGWLARSAAAAAATCGRRRPVAASVAEARCAAVFWSSPLGGESISAGTTLWVPYARDKVCMVACAMSHVPLAGQEHAAPRSTSIWAPGHWYWAWQQGAFMVRAFLSVRSLSRMTHPASSTASCTGYTWEQPARQRRLHLQRRTSSAVRSCKLVLRRRAPVPPMRLSHSC